MFRFPSSLWRRCQVFCHTAFHAHPHCFNFGLCTAKVGHCHVIYKPFILSNTDNWHQTQWPFKLTVDKCLCLLKELEKRHATIPPLRSLTQASIAPCSWMRVVSPHQPPQAQKFRRRHLGCLKVRNTRDVDSHHHYYYRYYLTHSISKMPVSPMDQPNQAPTTDHRWAKKFLSGWYRTTIAVPIPQCRPKKE